MDRQLLESSYVVGLSNRWQNDNVANYAESIAIATTTIQTSSYHRFSHFLIRIRISLVVLRS